MAHAGCHAGDLRVTAFNGRLFAAVADAAGRAPRSRQTRDRPGGPVAGHTARCRSLGPRADPYGDLGVEQLGAVYEALLDYEPRVEGIGSAARVTLRARLHAAKDNRIVLHAPAARPLSGPARTLAPLVDQAGPERILELKVLDPAMGSGAFLVAACEYLANAYETALIHAGGCHPSDLGPPERAAIRRRIAERCLFGVDLNPMAVQLARLSLWLLTLAADRPLSSSITTCSPATACWARGSQIFATRRTGAVQRQRRRRCRCSTRRRSAMRCDERCRPDSRWRPLPETPSSTSARRNALLAAMNGRDGALTRWKRVADLWCAAWFGCDMPALGLWRAVRSHPERPERAFGDGG